MDNHKNELPVSLGALLVCLGLLLGNPTARAGDAAQLISSNLPNGVIIPPRATFTNTWTFKNTGTTTWTPTYNGYTLNLYSLDTLGAAPLAVNTIGGSWRVLAAAIASGKSVAPGASASFSLSFIAPETPGSYTDTFTLANVPGVNFGPLVTIAIVVPPAGSTNQYDRSRALSYANNYAGCVCNDGYFWTNGSNFADFGAGAPVPTAYLGDDCAHFVSSCLGQSGSHWGGGLNIPTRVPPAYGEPAATRIVNNCLLWPGYAVEVFSLTNLEPGDVIGWNWEGDTNVDNLDHVTLYLGNGLVASHAQSALDVSATTFFQSGEPNWKWHLIHILDAPALAAYRVKTNIVLSWGTNWSGYALYSSTNLTTWTKVTKSPTAVGVLNLLTNSVTPGATYYRLRLP